MHHSFHGGGHLARSPSSGVLLHDCPLFSSMGLSRVLKKTLQVWPTSQPKLHLTNRKLNGQRPLRHGAGQELPTLLPSLTCIYQAQASLW